MALKRILQTLDGLSDAEKQHYKQVERDGKIEYQLDLGGDEDVAGLLRAKNHEKEQRQSVQAQLDAERVKSQSLESQLAQANTAAKDLPGLQAQFNQKLTDMQTQFNEQLKARDATAARVAVEAKAAALAAELSTSPVLMKDFIAKQLKGEMRDGQIDIFVVDEKGERSIKTIEQLKEDLKANEQFKPILIGSRAAGGGSNGGGGGASQGTFNGKKFADLNDKERIDFHNTDPEGFKKAYGIK